MAQVQVKGVDVEDGEERDSLQPDSELAMAGVALQQLIQDHFTELFRCVSLCVCAAGVSDCVSVQQVVGHLHAYKKLHLSTLKSAVSKLIYEALSHSVVSSCSLITGVLSPCVR